MASGSASQRAADRRRVEGVDGLGRGGRDDVDVVHAERVLGQEGVDRLDGGGGQPARDEDRLPLDVVPVVVVDEAPAEPEARLRGVEVARVARHLPAEHEAGAEPAVDRIEERAVDAADHDVDLAPCHGRVGVPAGHVDDLHREVLGRQLAERVGDQQGRHGLGPLGHGHPHRCDLGQRLGLRGVRSAARQHPVDRQVLGVGGGRLAAPVAGVARDPGAGGVRRGVGRAAVLAPADIGHADEHQPEDQGQRPEDGSAGRGTHGDSPSRADGAGSAPGRRP